MTVLLCMFLAIAVSANAPLNKIWTDSTQFIERVSKSSPEAKDTIFVPASAENPNLSYQNVIFKQRLDSLQNTVALSYNEHVQTYIDLYLKRKEQIGKMLGLSKYYFPIFEKALKETGIPEEIKFITIVESALNPHAVSRSGAVGPWQFMYTTAKGYGLIMDNDVDERKDPVKASYAAAHYLLDAYNRVGDWLLAIAAFNCGTGAVTRAIKRSGGIADFWKVRSFLPPETQNYVPAFIATVYAMNYYKKHEIDISPAGFNILTDVIQVNKRISISSIAKAADLDLKELLILNPSYKKQIVNGTIESPKPLVIPDVRNSAYASLYDVLNGIEPGINHEILKANLEVSAGSKSVSEKQEPGYFNYIVKAGDTLSEIAEKFKGATISKIEMLNGLTTLSILKPGMNLKINKG